MNIQKELKFGWMKGLNDVMKKGFIFLINLFMALIKVIAKTPKFMAIHTHLPNY
jgi:hypothetical protein